MKFIVANSTSTAESMPSDPSIWGQYGLPGLMLLAMSSFIVYIIRLHSTERKEWRNDHKELAAKFDQTQQESTDKFVQLHTDMLNRLTSEDGNSRLS